MASRKSRWESLQMAFSFFFSFMARPFLLIQIAYFRWANQKQSIINEITNFWIIVSQGLGVLTINKSPKCIELHWLLIMKRFFFRVWLIFKCSIHGHTNYTLLISRFLNTDLETDQTWAKRILSKLKQINPRIKLKLWFFFGRSHFCFVKWELWRFWVAWVRIKIKKA